MKIKGFRVTHVDQNGAGPCFAWRAALQGSDRGEHARDAAGSMAKSRNSRPTSSARCHANHPPHSELPDSRGDRPRPVVHHLCMDIPNTTNYESLIVTNPVRTDPSLDAVGQVESPNQPGLGQRFSPGRSVPAGRPVPHQPLEPPSLSLQQRTTTPHGRVLACSLIAMI